MSNGMKNPFTILRLLPGVRRPSSIDAMPVVCDGFWLGKGFSAITFFGTVVAASASVVTLLERSDSTLLRHEMIHLRQAQATHDSWLLFYALYLWHYLRALPQNRKMRNAAYWINPFELEAYHHERMAGYLEGCKKNGAIRWRVYARMTPKERMMRYYPHYA